MYDDNVYNLMMQLVQEHKSLWRIQKSYKKDAKGAEADLRFWKRLEADKLRHIEELKALLKVHL